MHNSLSQPHPAASNHWARRLGWLVLALAGSLFGAALAQAAPQPGSKAAEAPFMAENGAAMDRMMAAMTIEPSGDVDADFAAMMIPHHQGAIDMAEAELRHGRNETLRRIAQEIVVEQQQEIAAMRLALGQPLPPSMPSPTAPASVFKGATHPLPPGAMRLPLPLPATAKVTP